MSFLKSLSFFSLACFLLCLGATGCRSEKGESPVSDSLPESSESAPVAASPDGTYRLVKKTVGDVDFTSFTLQSTLVLDGESAVWLETDYSGLSTREGSYTLRGESAVLVFDRASYSLKEDPTGESLTLSQKKGGKTCLWLFEKESPSTSLPSSPGTSSGVDFTSELFGDDSEQNFYNYCPSVMLEGSDTLHVWYCSNKTSGNVTDYIFYRKGTLDASGKWSFSEKTVALAPDGDNKGSWDDRHNCDPSVVKGAFTLNGETYSYLLSYLGCRSNDINQVGIAVSKTPEGPYLRVPDVNPLCNFFASPDYNPANVTWGYGQPSLVSVDRAGKVLLFYTRGTPSGTYTQVEEWDLSDLSAPKKLRAARVSEQGIPSNTDIHGADFAYDPVRERIYFVTDNFPIPTDGGVNVISKNVSLYYTSLGQNGLDRLFGDGGSYTWQSVGEVNLYARNHNAGLLTDEYGLLTDPYRLPLLFTKADLATDFPGWPGGGQWPFLHTYRLHGYVAALN